jgi:oligogalacturonide lyase
VQLTSGEKLSPNGGCVSRNGHLYYFDGPVLRSVNVETLEERQLYRVPNGFHGGLPTCSPDGHYVVFAYRQTLPLSTATGLIYSTMAEEYYQHPQSVVMRVDTAAASAVCVWGDTTWISHSLIHPTLPNLILLCHEGGSTVVSQRMWMVDINQKRARQALALYPQKHGETCVHEFFTKQGEVGVQYSLDRGEDREEYNMFLRTDGTWIRQYRFPGKRPGHIQSNSDNTLCVGDCGYLTAKDEDGDQYISLMKHNNGEVQSRRLAWHRTSWNTQESHPHPVFSPDDRWVLYNSDVEKRYNVYMADTQSI